MGLTDYRTYRREEMSGYRSRGLAVLVRVH
jgi:hypothetical protein